MRIVIQRCLDSSVSVSNKVVGKIEKGMVILVGFTYGDDETIIDKMIQKILKLRIFDDEDGIMNKSIIDIDGSILSVSQFTLYADTKKGNRPSYIKALGGEDAIKLYDMFNEELGKYVHVETGEFGADMIVNISNIGPTTIMLEK